MPITGPDIHNKSEEYGRRGIKGVSAEGALERTCIAVFRDEQIRLEETGELRRRARGKTERTTKVKRDKE